MIPPSWPQAPGSDQFHPPLQGRLPLIEAKEYAIAYLDHPTTTESSGHGHGRGNYYISC
jgi:hypothetical protein